MDIMQAFRYVFDSDKWINKILVGALINLVPIFQLATLGYGLDIVRNVADGVDDPLPYWEDIGDKFMKGLFAGIAMFIYMLVPSIILSCIIGVPIAVAGAAGEDTAGVVATVAGLCGGLLGFILMLAVLVIYLAALVRFTTVSQEFGTFFQFGESMNLLRENAGVFARTILFIILAELIVGFLAPIVIVISVITICGPFILLFALPIYSQCIVMHMIGQMTQELNLKGVPAV